MYLFISFDPVGLCVNTIFVPASARVTRGPPAPSPPQQQQQQQQPQQQPQQQQHRLALKGIFQRDARSLNSRAESSTSAAKAAAAGNQPSQAATSKT